MARAKVQKPLTEAGLMALLRERFKAPEYAFLPHVRNGTGYTRRTTRTADALAMSLWPSRGLDLHGIEIKSDRADWLREKENPEKAEEIARFCDRWWLVIGRADIVQTGELPATWGLMVPEGGKLVVVKEAAKLEALQLDRSQLAAILRKAAEAVVPKVELDAEMARRIEEVRAKADATVDALVKSHTRHLQNQVDHLTEKVDRFEKSSGVDLSHTWKAGEIGEAVKFILAGGLEHARRDLEEMRARARAIAEAIDEQLGAGPARTGTGGA